LRVTAVIPAYNASATLPLALRALLDCRQRPEEIIVVDDGSIDNTPELARDFGAKVLLTGGRKGPAFARNLGARESSGELLLFLDADVTVHEDTVERIRAVFAANPGLAAVMGSYDNEPAHQSFVSQYRNLMHSFVHRKGRKEATTFWAGCGAIRREVFQEYGGFDADRFGHPCIEDVELGERVSRGGKRILLDCSIEVRHHKAWTLGSMIWTDFYARGLPWTELILESRHMENDLNISWSQRASVALVWLGAGFLLIRWWPGALAAFLSTVVINRDFYRFLIQHRGAWFAIRAFPLRMIFHFQNGAAFLAGLARWLMRGAQRRII
jgi:glycosyltransferase involved in cell wall biosynthesis